MNNEQYDEIKKLADEKYNGNLDLAIAHILYGEFVIVRCGGNVPTFADQEKMNELKNQFVQKEKADQKPPSKLEPPPPHAGQNKAAGEKKPGGFLWENKEAGQNQG